MTEIYPVLMIVVIAAVTELIRFAPFVIFGKRQETPELIIYLGKVLPYAIMGMLVVFCLKGISLSEAPYGLPELLAGFLVVALHVWKRNTLLSIVGGTACYMVLIRLTLF